MIIIKLNLVDSSLSRSAVQCLPEQEPEILAANSFRISLNSVTWLSSLLSSRAEKTRAPNTMYRRMIITRISSRPREPTSRLQLPHSRNIVMTLDHRWLWKIFLIKLWNEKLYYIIRIEVARLNYTYFHRFNILLKYWNFWEVFTHLRSTQD